ncbi:MAG: hypothetical protein IIA67_07070 [Planctomycetes bacterium]|nr:hypothetical protein [Planctomycetota bacterium]
MKAIVNVILDACQNKRKYKDGDFPLSAAEFARFRNQVTQRFVSTLGLEKWTVRKLRGKECPIAGRFVDKHLKTIEHHGIQMEVHVIEIPETGMTLPAILRRHRLIWPSVRLAGWDSHPRKTADFLGILFFGTGKKRLD